MSEEHKQYLKKEKKYNFSIRLAQYLIVVLFLLIWELLVRLNVINPFIFSSPTNVLNTLIELHKTNNLYQHILITTYETFLGFSLGSILGIFIAALLWWFKSLNKVLDPYLTVLNSLPKVALGPIIIIWVGASIKSIIVMTLMISLIIAIINFYQGFTNIDENKINLLKSFKATKKQMFFKLILPGSKKSIINALKVNISMALIGVIMGEFLVSKSGIGYLIMYGSQVFNLNLVITGIFILCLESMAMYKLINYLEKLIIKN